MRIVPVGSMATVPVTVAPPPVNVNVAPGTPVVMVVVSIASLKVAETVVGLPSVPTAMLVLALAGVAEAAVTVGAGPCAVVNDQELTLAKALPVAPTAPVVTAAVYVTPGVSDALGVSVAVKLVAL